MSTTPIKNKKYNVGVIVGRFQVSELHPGHVQLITHVMNECEQVIIFLGTTTVLDSTENALSYFLRAGMIRKSFIGGNIVISAIADRPSHYDWDVALDEKIREMVPLGTVMLYGSRTSFVDTYGGSFRTTKLPSYVSENGDEVLSGTEVRKSIAGITSPYWANTANFRAGVIHGKMNQYRKIHPTVDIAVLNRAINGEYLVLMGKKPGETSWRFPGGFADVCDESFEEAAIREIHEEAGLDLEIDRNLTYICSQRINDWRYRNESNKIITSFFAAKYMFGPIKASDDLAEVGWVLLNCDIEHNVLPGHRNLFTKLREFIKQNGDYISTPINSR